MFKLTVGPQHEQDVLKTVEGQSVFHKANRATQGYVHLNLKTVGVSLNSYHIFVLEFHLQFSNTARRITSHPNGKR